MFLFVVHQQVQDMREVLVGEWVRLQQVVIDCDIMLQKQKEQFRNSMIPEIIKKIKTMLEEFNSTGHTLAFSHIYTLTTRCGHVSVAFLSFHVPLLIYKRLL